MKNIHRKTNYSPTVDGQEIIYQEDKDGRLVGWTSVKKESIDIPYVPASIFDTDEVIRNGSADLLMKHPFKVGNDLESIDNAEDYLSHSVDSGVKAVFGKIKENSNSND